jgi:CheY-like chemotaxis protein
LQTWGFVVEVAANGQEALEKFVDSDFDLILMDLRMPVLDGYEATKKIRELPEERQKNVPIIAFSASTKIGEEDLVEITDFNDVMGKPFRAEELFGKIAFYTGRSQTSFAGRPAQSSKRLEPVDREPALFSLEGYYESLDGDRNEVAEIVQLVVNSYQDAERKMADAIARRDLAKFEFEAHRIKSSMEILKAEPLKLAIESGRRALTSGAPVESAAAVMQNRFVATISGLKAALDL